MMVVDLARWLGAQLDEDERIARAATPGPWWVDSTIHAESINASDGTTVVSGGRWGDEASVFESDEDAAHIVRHDPSRALRGIDAKRQIMRQAFKHAATIDGEWGCCHDAEAIEAGHCEEQLPDGLPLLRLLALPYADRPGYREEWRP